MNAIYLKSILGPENFYAQIKEVIGSHGIKTFKAACNYIKWYNQIY